MRSASGRPTSSVPTSASTLLRARRSAWSRRRGADQPSRRRDCHSAAPPSCTCTPSLIRCFSTDIIIKRGGVIKMKVSPTARPATGPTFNNLYPTAFQPSQISGAGRGWWAAAADIPMGTLLRRVSVADGSLVRIGSEAALHATGWSSRRRDCHFADALSPSLLKCLLTGEGGGRMKVSPTATRLEHPGKCELWDRAPCRPSCDILPQPR